jgi:hypothetical protein
MTTTQDAGVRAPAVRLRRVLVFARLLAGRRGHSSITWHGQGFTYELTSTRDPYADPSRIEVDADEDVDDGLDLGGDVVLHVAQLAELVTVQP